MNCLEITCSEHLKCKDTKRDRKDFPSNKHSSIIYRTMLVITRLIQLYISLSYVITIYVSTNQPLSHKQRNEPRIIRQRMKYIIYICCINTLLIPIILNQTLNTNLSYIDFLLQIGIIPGYQFNGTWDLKKWVYDNLRCVSLICILYMGPLIDLILYYTLYKRYDNIWYDFINNFNNIWGVRNYIFAPITEELMFTGMLMSCQMISRPPLKTGWDLMKFITGPSLYFGVAHVHHAWEMIQDKDYSMSQIILITMFQALYTTIFGTLSNYIYLITGGNLWSCILLHGICNLLGFPGEPELTVKIKSHRGKMLWNRLYTSLLVIGLISFISLLISGTSYSDYTSYIVS